jgi:hypothetical protein
MGLQCGSLTVSVGGQALEDERMSITREQAQDLASGKVRELARDAGDDFAIAPAETVQREEGWLFFYNSRDFVETGDPLSALAGNGPILVTTSGEVREISSAVGWNAPGALDA